MKEKPEIIQSPLDLWKLMGGKAKEVSGKGRGPRDSLLAVYKDRLTFTFILGEEVASIHFDKVRNEIFFKGHNIRNLDLDETHFNALNDFKAILANDEKGKEFLENYNATLGPILADKYREGKK